jgi:hypothetical protein
MQNRIELRIAERTAFADGQAFGAHGPYERLRGWSHFAVDPKAPAQAGVTDLDKAPLNAGGLVEFAAEFVLLTPDDPERGNRRLFHDWGNRGNCRALQFFCDAPHSNDPRTAADAGNGFLFRRGYSFVWSAWQADLLPGNGRLTMAVPVASDNGRPLTGLVRQEFIPRLPTPSYPLSGRASTRSHAAVSRDTARARLTRRRYPDEPRQPIPADAWRFAQVQAGEAISGEGGAVEVGITPSDAHVCLDGGFQPGWIYELVYEGRDPLVSGLGHVAVRELVSFLKYGAADAAGTPNPVGRIEKAYGWGRSQTGRCIRDFVHGGFNADAAGRRVFDGLMPHVAGAGLMWMNHRFANLVSAAGQQYEDHHNIADRFPFAYGASTDHLTGRTDAILKRPDTDPLVIHTQTATEYWQRKGSLVHTDSRGRDLEPPEGARVYLWSSSQHFANPHLGAPAKGVCQNLANVVDTSMLFRAMLDALDRWASEGKAPPASRIPRRTDGTLVNFQEWRERFPAIPGVAVPRGPASLPLLDFGVDNGVLTKEPPEIVDAEGYPVLVPAVDADGNDVAGVRAPMVAAPLGTYTGWNLRVAGHGGGANHEFTGSYIPFADTAEERVFSGDSRPAVLERHATPEAYVAAIERAARALVAEGLMLEEDVERCRRLARDWGRPRHVVRL